MPLNWPQLNEKFNQLIHFKELFNIGSYFIQPHVMHVNVQSNSENNPWHVHRTFEYTLLLSGEMVYCMENRELLQRPGDVVIIPPELRHCWRVISDEAMTFGFMLYVSCQGDGSRQNLKQLHEKIVHYDYQIKDFSETAKIIQDIIITTEKWESYSDEKILCLSREAYIELFKRIAPEPRTVPKRPAELRLRGDDPRNIIEAAQYYIRDNAHLPIRPAEVCRHVGMSINDLNLILKKYGNRSVGQTIIQRKLFLACGLLDNSNRLVKDIAASLGFEDIDYFCRLFKRHHGLSPSEYRTKNRG